MLICVIGSGVVGLTCALDLALAGHKVKVITRNYEEGASWVAGGMLAPFSEGLEGDILRLSIESLRLYDEYVSRVEEVSGHSILYRRNGILRILDSGEVEAYKALADSYRALGFDSQPLEGSSLREAFGLLSEEISSAILFKDEGNVDSQQLMDALIFAMHRLGVEIVLDEVHKIKIEDGRVEEVIGFKNGYGADFYVFSPGAWGSALLGIPVYPLKGQILKVRGLDIDRVLYSPYAYIIPKENYTLIGATSEDVSFDHRRTLGGVRSLGNNAARVVPSIDECEFVEVNVGFRPATPDHLPVFDVGENYVVSAGHFRNGILLAPVSSKVVVDLLERGVRSEYFELFPSKRFQNGNHTDKS